MPADRKRASKKEDTPAIQLTWTTPVEADSAAPISFAPSLTPTSFDACDTKFNIEPMDDADGAPSEPSLFPPIVNGAEPPRKPTHAKKKAENHIPRPPNAFILFRSSFIKSQHVSNEVEGNHSTLSKIIGLTWQNMPDDERKFWHGKAKAAQADHKRKYPDYAFRPLHGRGPSAQPKRKVREVAPKDIDRCARIAELLVEGKKGADLEAAMQEFDRTNVKPIVARFEAPLTARQYRKRSCSQPPELESTVSNWSAPSSPKPSKKRLRATSSQPVSRRFHSVKASTSPSTPTASTPAPSTPIAPSTPTIVEVHEETYAEMPPLVLPPVAHPGVAYHPFNSGESQSFSFDTFVFNEGPAAYVEACDPLSAVPTLNRNSPAVCSTPDSQSGQQAPACAGFPPLSIDTSFYDSWSNSTSSPSFPASPCTPGGYLDQAPPFSALPSGNATPAFAHTNMLATPPSKGYIQNPVFDAQAYGTVVFTTAPPYLDLSSSFVAAVTQSGQQDTSPTKGDYPYYSQKLVDKPHLAIGYTAQDLFAPYSL